VAVGAATTLRARGWSGRLALAVALALPALACLTEGARPPPSQRMTPLAVQPGAPGRVLLISIAGLTPDRYLDPSPAMPLLASMAASGIAGEALVPVQPDTPFPVHATLVTGRRPASHGIVADHLIGDRGVRPVKYWHASRLTAPTLWEVVRAAGLEVTALGWPTTVGADIDLLLPDLEVVRETDTWLDLEKQTATPRLSEHIRQQVEGSSRALAPGWPGPADRDDIVLDLACWIARDPNPPQLWLLRFVEPAAVEQTDGPWSDAARSAFARVDARLDRLRDCLDHENLLSSAAFVVVGDRALEPVHTAILPNVVLAGAGLVTLSEDRTGIDGWKALARSNGGSAFVYANGEDAAVAARGVLGEVARRSRSFRVVPATELQTFQIDPEAWFGLEAEPGFVFHDEATGSAIQPAPERAAGGYLQEALRHPAGFVAWGQGLRGPLRAPEVRAEDVAPTLAALLGVALEGGDGRLLIGLLDRETGPVGSAAPAASREP